jgi:hypothetical protein
MSTQNSEEGEKVKLVQKKQGLPVITKEQMKTKMLKHDYFDTEILYHGMKNTRTDDHKKSEKDLLDEQQLKEVLEEIKQECAKQGEKEYHIMEIQPGALKKVQFYKKLLFFVNIPLICGIPIFVQFGLPNLEKKDFNMIYVILNITDFFLCFNSLVIYCMISKIVTGISYLPEEHKIKIKQWTGKFISEKITTYNPKEIIKCKKQVLNPFIGYRSVTNASERFGTESTGMWHDRQLFDSMIFREIKRRGITRAERKAEQGKQEGSNETKKE